jgi:hypothetical protein
MRPRSLLRPFLVVVVVGSGVVAAQEPDKSTPTPSDVTLEVNALQSLRQFKFTTNQLQKLRQWTKETAAQDRPRDSKASKEYREKLAELANALYDDNDDQIDSLNEQLDELRHAEKPSIDDGVDVTDAARKRASEAFRLLKAGQLAMYVGQIAEDVQDPFDQLMDGLEIVRRLKGAEWREKREEIADNVSHAVAGVDADKGEQVNDTVLAWLIRGRRLGEKEFDAKRGELEKEAREIVSNIRPDEVLRNRVEFALAELLSNPRLPAVLERRLK